VLEAEKALWNYTTEHDVCKVCYAHEKLIDLMQDRAEAMRRMAEIAAQIEKINARIAPLLVDAGIKDEPTPSNAA
jgi:ethanolamine utilization protein EutA (predicted chaperonin)